MAIPDYDAIETVEALETVIENDTSGQNKIEEKENKPAQSKPMQSTTIAVPNEQRKILGENDTENSNVDLASILMGQRNILYASLLDSLKNETELKKLKLMKKE